MAPDLDVKRLELLKEAFPKVARVAFLWGSGRANLFTESAAAAKALGLKLQSLPVRSLDDFDSAFARAKRDGAQALITFPRPLINTQQRQVLDFAAKNRLPAMYAANEFVEAGGEPRANRVIIRRHDDGNRNSRLLSRTGRCRTPRND